MSKDKEYMKMIHSTQWLKLRSEVLTAHPLCQRCEAEGLITAASEVHHIMPVEEAILPMERKARMFSASNLMALCHACHVKTHTEMGRCGKTANIERNKKKVEEINKRFFGD